MGLVGNENKQQKKQEICDRMKKQEDLIYKMEQRLSSIESDSANLKSLYRDIESFLCIGMKMLIGEKSKFNLKGFSLLGSENERLQKELHEKEQWAEELNHKLMEEKEKADGLGKKYKAIQDSVEEAYAKNEALKQKKEEAEELFGKKKKELENLKAETEQLKEKLEERDKEIERLQGVNNNLKEENDAVVNDLKQSLLQEQNQVKQFKNKFGCWKEETKDYQDLLEAVFACDSLTDMMRENELVKSNGSQDVANLIHFIKLLGDQVSFLPILYYYLEEYKKISRQSVSQEERKLFSCLNLYYKKNYGVPGNLICCPQEVGKFDKQKMSDFDNRTKTFRSIDCVYVPAIMRDERTYLKLALVKGVL